MMCIFFTAFLVQLPFILSAAVAAATVDASVPPAIPPIEDYWAELTPKSYYRCSSAPGNAPLGNDVRNAVESFSTRKICPAIPTPPCKELGRYNAAVVSLCATGDRPGARKEDCAEVRELTLALVGRCQRRGIAGGFVKMSGNQTTVSYGASFVFAATLFARSIRRERAWTGGRVLWTKPKNP